MKERSRQLTDVYRKVSAERNKQWLGWEGEVIVDEKVKDGVSARNYAYKTIVIRKDIPLGTVLKVKITEASTHFLAALPN
jgi:tRNA A37 methylthiotransferase MiaB